MRIAIRLNYKLMDIGVSVIRAQISGSFPTLGLLIVVHLVVIRILFVGSFVTLLVSRFVAY